MNEKKVSRRGFLKMAGLGAAAATLTCAGLGYAGSRAPVIETPELTYGEDVNMNKRILVAYDTVSGTTVDVAAEIGERLSSRGFMVDVKPMKENPDVKAYQAVVIGSPIRMSNWLSGAKAFVKNNQDTLVQVPVAMFSVHILDLGEDEASKAIHRAYLDPMRPMVNLVSEAAFAGYVNMEKLSFIDRMMAKAVKSPVGDQRDWTKIQSWADSIFPTL